MSTTDRQEINPHKEPPPYWQFRTLVWATVAVAVAAAVAAAASSYQAYLVRDNNIVTQRAFVYAEAPRLIVSLDPKDRSSKILNLFIPLANTGSTATQDLEFLVRCV